MKKNIFILLMAVVIGAMVCGCDKNPRKAQANPTAEEYLASFAGKEYETEGVLIHVVNSEKWWVRNTGTAPLRLRFVFFCNGVYEQTSWMCTLNAEEKTSELNFNGNWPSNFGLYIYDARGACLLDFLRIGCSTEKSLDKK